MAADANLGQTAGGARHRAVVYRTAQIAVGWIIRLAFAARRRGVNKIPRHGPVILASNHASNIDPVLVVSCVRRPVFHLAKAELFGNWFGRWFFGTLGGQIPVDRSRGDNEAAFDAGLGVLRDHRALGIYPEGRRTMDGKLLPFHTGVARLALTEGAPIFPVAIVGTRAAWPRGRRFPRLFRRTQVIVGDAIIVDRDPEAAQDAARCKALSDRLRRDLAALLEPQPPPPKG